MAKKKHATADGSKQPNERKSCRYGKACHNAKCKFSHTPERVLVASNDNDEQREANNDNLGERNNKENNDKENDMVNNISSNKESENGVSNVGQPHPMRLMSESAQKHFLDRIASLEQQNRNLTERLDNVHWEQEKELQNIHLVHQQEVESQKEHEAEMAKEIQALTLRLKQLQSKHDKQAHKFKELQATRDVLLKKQADKQEKALQTDTRQVSDSKAVRTEQQEDYVPAKASKVTQNDRARDNASSDRASSSVTSNALTRTVSQDKLPSSAGTMVNESKEKQTPGAKKNCPPEHTTVSMRNDTLQNGSDEKKQGAETVDPADSTTKANVSTRTNISMREEERKGAAKDSMKVKSAFSPISSATTSEKRKLVPDGISNTMQTSVLRDATTSKCGEEIREVPTAEGKHITASSASSNIVADEKPPSIEVVEGGDSVNRTETAEICHVSYKRSDRTNGNSASALADVGRGITSGVKDANFSVPTKLGAKTNTKSTKLYDAARKESLPVASDVAKGAPSSGSLVSKAQIEDTSNDNRRLMEFLFPKIVKDKRPHPTSMDDSNLRTVIQEKSVKNEIVAHFIATKLATFDHERAKQFVRDANRFLDEEKKQLKNRKQIQVAEYETQTKELRNEQRRLEQVLVLDGKLEELEKLYIDPNKLVRGLSNLEVGYLSKRLQMIPNKKVSPIFDLIKGDEDAARKGRKYLELEHKIQVAKTSHQNVKRVRDTLAAPFQKEKNEHTAAVSNLEEKLATLRIELLQASKAEQAEIEKAKVYESLLMTNTYVLGSGEVDRRIREAARIRGAARIRKKLRNRENIDKATRIREKLRNRENVEDAPTAEELAWLGEEIKANIAELENSLANAAHTLKGHEAKKKSLGEKRFTLREELQALSNVEKSSWFQRLNSDEVEKTSWFQGLYSSGKEDRTAAAPDRASIREKLNAKQFRKICDKMVLTSTGVTLSAMELKWVPTAKELAWLRKVDEEDIAEAEKLRTDIQQMIEEHKTTEKILKEELPLLRKQLQEVSSEEHLRSTRPLILPLELSLAKLDLPVRESQDKLGKLRLELSNFLGKVGKENPEDARFNIDGLRDERGHSFLLVAVLLGDIETTEMCCRLGADPNEECRGQLTPMSVASYFNLKRLTQILTRYGSEAPTSTDEPWMKLGSAGVHATDEKQMDWESILEIANRAAEPAQEEGQAASLLEADEKSRMHILTETERSAHQLMCFDAALTDASNSGDIRRQILLEKSVYSWFQDTLDDRSLFLEFLTSLLPEQHRRRPVRRSFSCSRRAVVGLPTQMQYEVLAVKLRESQMVMFTPFITNAIEGYVNVGVLVWAVCPDSSASFYKNLIQNTEFIRNKVESGDIFPEHAPCVLELGKDMHLLDLTSTNIYTSRPSTLFVVNIDEGELELLEDPSFTPKKRMLDYEEKIDRALFSQSEEQAADEREILSAAGSDTSTVLSGGAGTGKTALLSKKLVNEPLHTSCLVVTRLPRLLSLVKHRVEKERDSQSIRFITYEDLMSELAYKVSAPKDKKHTFGVFSKVDFDSYVQEFVNGYLTASERKRMKALHIEDLTLYSAIRTIKSNSRCLEKLEPLSREAYMQLPDAFGLDQKQRSLVYELYGRYQDWLSNGNAKWDEADRTLYVLKFGPSVFRQHEFLSWYKRYIRGIAEDTVTEDGRPLQPFFHDKVVVDEAQDFSELDLNLFVRMGRSVKSAFFAADAAQSVEIGLSMRKSTINDVIHTSLYHRKDVQVKNVLQTIQMRINHRTHEQNLLLSKAVRSLMTRSFEVPGTQEHALITGKLPQVLTIHRLEDLCNESIFRAANIAFICPDEIVEQVRSFFAKNQIRCDVFGVREAKGLEFDTVALLQFFSHFDQRKDLGDAWRNSLRWLFSDTGVTTTDSTEKVLGKPLKPCNYLLSHPELQDQMAVLYTALTRSRNRLYIIEVGGDRKSLGDFAFRCFTDNNLGLAERVESIDEGRNEMTPQQHKARGVLMVTQAFNMSRENKPFSQVQAKFEEARGRFGPDKGNDKQLLDLCTKHMNVMRQKQVLLETIRTKFFNHQKGEYDLQGQFITLLKFERQLVEFFSDFDAFVVEELQEVAGVVSQMIVGSPYAHRLGKMCRAIQERI